MALSNDLTELESEFRILNQELESKTEELLKRADSIVKHQEKSMQDLVTPVTTERQSIYDAPNQKDENLKKKSTRNNNYCHFSDNSRSSSASSHRQRSSDDESITSEKHIKQLLEKRLELRNNRGDFDNRVSSAREALEVMKNLNNIELENFDDDSELDDVDGMMKVLRDQKRYNKSVISLMHTRDSIRNKEFTDGSFGFDSSRKNASDPAKQRAELRLKGDYRKTGDDLPNLKQTGISPHEHLMVKSLQAKVKSLQEELQKTKDSLKKKSSECEQAVKVNQGLVENKLKLLAQINSLRNQNIKLETKMSGTVSKLQVKESECAALAAGSADAARALRAAGQGEAGTAARLAKATQELSSLSGQLAAAKLMEKDLREESQRKLEQLSAALVRGEKSSQVAARAIRGQALLADNLRRQVALLSAGREVRTIEGQLDNLLQWEN